MKAVRIKCCKCVLFFFSSKKHSFKLLLLNFIATQSKASKRELFHIIFSAKHFASYILKNHLCRFSPWLRVCGNRTHFIFHWIWLARCVCVYLLFSLFKCSYAYAWSFFSFFRLSRANLQLRRSTYTFATTTAKYAVCAVAAARFPYRLVFQEQHHMYLHISCFAKHLPFFSVPFDSFIQHLPSFKHLYNLKIFELIATILEIVFITFRMVPEIRANIKRTRNR